MPAAALALSDPLERALQYRDNELCRKDVNELGFLEWNRGDLGISGYHIHEVAHSCLGGVKSTRYKQVDIVRVPDNHLAAWREANARKCKSDAFMPKFSPTMKYACLTKTHFTHANKLEQDGNRTLFNAGKVPIKFKATSIESRRIKEEGLVVSTYRSELWEDRPALMALMRADNDDAEIELREDEIQAQGRVDASIKELQLVHPEKHVTVDQVLEHMKRQGLSTFSEEQTQTFIEFRLSITEGVGVSFLCSLGGVDSGFQADGLDSGFEVGGLDSGFQAGGLDSRFQAGGLDSGFQVGGIDSGFQVGGLDSGLQVGPFVASVLGVGTCFFCTSAFT